MKSKPPLQILAFDTSGDACSVALLIQETIFTRFELAPRQHTQLILPMIEQVLQEADLTLQQLDAIAFGCGPGSFTGLRIAAGVVQGIAFAADLPVIPISTLQALAQGALRETGCSRVISAIDACMNEIYWAAFAEDNQQLMQSCTAEIVCAPAALMPPPGLWSGVGSGWDSYHTILQSKISAEQSWSAKAQVNAQDIVHLAKAAYEEGKQVPAEHALPVYVRNQIVKEKEHG